MPCPQCAAILTPDATRCQTCGAKLPEDAKSDPLLGRVLLDKYKLLRRIGAGSYGAVYEAEHLALSCRVAVKLFHPGPGQPKEAVARFRREALVASRLKHPYAVKIFDRGETPEGFLWIAMELLEGEGLDLRLAREGLFSEEELIALFGPLCEVLGEAHEKGVVHRDLKPANLMLVTGPEGKPLARVLDFGIAGLRGAPDLTEPDLVSGTPRYMAPEQWQGLARAESRSDIYALGVIAYQCLSGRLPLDAATPLAWIRTQEREEPLDIRVAMNGRPLTEQVARAVMRALSKDPEGRPQTTRELLRELRGCLSEEAAPAKARGERAGRARTSARGFLGLALGASLFLAAALFGAPLLGLRQPTSAAPATAAAKEPRASFGATSESPPPPSSDLAKKGESPARAGKSAPSSAPAPKSTPFAAPLSKETTPHPKEPPPVSPRARSAPTPPPLDVKTDTVDPWRLE